MAWSASQGQAQTLLSGWTFNNDSNAFGGFYQNQNAVGSFSSTAASYGETYTSGTLDLTSNTAMGAVYSGANVFANFTNAYAQGDYDQNGGYPNDYGFGAGYDAATNTSAVNPAGGSGGAGSIFVFGGGGTNVDFNLTSSGFHGLSLSFNAAAITYNGNNSFTLSSYSVLYSTDGGNTFTAIVSGQAVPEPGNGTDATFSLQNVALPAALNDLATFDLRINLNVGNNNAGHGGDEVDNVMLTGISNVPEPSTWALAGLGFLTVAGCAVRRRRC